MENMCWSMIENTDKVKTIGISDVQSSVTNVNNDMYRYWKNFLIFYNGDMQGAWTPQGWRLRAILPDTLRKSDQIIWRVYKLFRSRDMGRAVAVRRWTTTALECYKRGCNCEGCFYKDFFSGSSQKCQMKASVLELVRVIGAPNVELQQFLIED